ncbi:hypothetical protein C8F04DRAFT_1266756 [Mycena alexandri]|uniref:Uncharacterized protein n=1 Tax=Mycena alexandri TaxID=1745969 RepID=A0AAD6SGM9_9AGAR|nr:hypothetical protein C8F04DRAFT_1266756 [Mycena alexandri]
MTKPASLWFIERSLAVEGVMVKVEGNERPKGPITSHAKTNAAPLRPSSCTIPAQLKPVLPNSSASSSSPFSSTLATAVTAILGLGLACSRAAAAVSLSTVPISAPTSVSPATMDTAEHLHSLPQPILELFKPRANDKYCQQIQIPLGLSPPFHLPPPHNLLLDGARGDSSYVSCAHSKHADATQAAEAGNEHDESLIEQSTCGGDRSSRELALPARMGNVSPAGWVKTAGGTHALRVESPRMERCTSSGDPACEDGRCHRMCGLVPARRGSLPQGLGIPSARASGPLSCRNYPLLLLPLSSQRFPPTCTHTDPLARAGPRRGVVPTHTPLGPAFDLIASSPTPPPSLHQV